MNWSELADNTDGQVLADSCFVFGLHKCGSTLMHRMVRDVCTKADIPNLDIPGLAFEQGITGDVWKSDESLVDVFKLKKLFFGFRFFPEVLSNPDLNIRDKKFVLLVRDPRDALVSAYFSFGGTHMSHVMPEKNSEVFIERAQKTAGLDIDQYVIRRAKGARKKMRALKDNLDFKKGVIFRYEDIYFDKLTFLRSIFDHFGIDVDDKILKAVAKKNDVRPQEEDISKHIRKGTPGDHVDKLKPETIKKLNEMLSGISRFFGYDLK